MNKNISLMEKSRGLIEANNNKFLPKHFRVILKITYDKEKNIFKKPRLTILKEITIRQRADSP